MARDSDDDASHDPVADLAELKPAVERLRGLLQAAAADEEAAVCADTPVIRNRDGVDGGGPLEDSAKGSEPSPPSTG
jgi:hypothetical protein